MKQTKLTEVEAVTDLNSILFIDDEPDTLARLKSIFESHYICHIANTGKKGLALFNKRQPPLVVCDVNLPDISGFQICRELKTTKPHLCLILLSAYNDKESRLEGLEAFADSYIDKSLSDKEIYLRVRNLHPNSPELANTDEDSQRSSLEKELNHAFTTIYSSSTNTSATLEDLALQLALSPRTLQRKLKEESGLSFTQHHLNYRLKESQKRLQQGYSSTDISEMLGFSSPSHFSYCFKKQYGMTPSAYLHSIK